MGDLTTPVGAFVSRHYFNVGGSYFVDLCRESACKHDALSAWRCRPNGVRYQFDMRGSGTAAAANELGAILNESLGKLRHVLRRAHVELPALHVARQTRIR